MYLVIYKLLPNIEPKGFVYCGKRSKYLYDIMQTTVNQIN